MRHGPHQDLHCIRRRNPGDPLRRPAGARGRRPFSRAQAHADRPRPTRRWTDTFARALAHIAAAALGQEIVIDNKDGGGGALGVTHLVAARPDGYTLALVWNGPLTATPHNLTVPYAPTNYRPLLSIGYSSYVLCMRTGPDVANAASFAAHLKANDGKLSYGHDGAGGTMQLAAERVFDRLGVSLRGVPFGGAAETAEALVGGMIDVYGGSLPPILPHVAAGRVVCPLLTSAGGNEALPGAEGLGALGLEAEETVLWWGLLVPANTPEDIVARLTDAFAAAVRSPQFETLLRRKGAVPRLLGGSETAALINEEFAALAQVSRAIASRQSR
ncbi:MAG: tripartite tricarboxylate transporter substrate binding protein [Hyphomicrobiaceae bacterium]